MPTYEYACRDCGEHLEVVQSFRDDSLTICPNCEGELRKVFSAAGIIFKGSGWHVKDYASPSKSANGRSASESSDSSSDSGSAGSDAPEASSPKEGSSTPGEKAGTKASSEGSSDKGSSSSSVSDAKSA